MSVFIKLREQYALSGRGKKFLSSTKHSNWLGLSILLFSGFGGFFPWEKGAGT